MAELQNKTGNNITETVPTRSVISNPDPTTTLNNDDSSDVVTSSVDNKVEIKDVDSVLFVSFRTSTKRAGREASLRVSTLNYQKLLRLSSLKVSRSCRAT